MTARPQNIGGLKSLLHRDIKEPINVNAVQKPIVSEGTETLQRQSTNRFKDRRFELERKVECMSVHWHRHW